MGVYVNPVQGRGEYPKYGQWPFCQYCQMAGDSREELEAFAHSIGIERSAYTMLESRIPVYYLNMFQRARAISAGAKELSVSGVRVFVDTYKLRHKL